MVFRVPKIVLVTGVPGAGKSTLSSAVAVARAGVAVLEVGQRMGEIAGSMGLIPGYSELPSLPAMIRSQLQAAAISSVPSSDASIVLVVGHLQVLGPEGWLPGFPAGVLEALGLAKILLVEAESRIDDQAGGAGFSTAAYRELAMGTAAALGVPIATVDNSGTVAEGVERMRHLMSSIDR